MEEYPDRKTMALISLVGKNRARINKITMISDLDVQDAVEIEIIAWGDAKDPGEHRVTIHARLKDLSIKHETVLPTPPNHPHER